MCICRIIVIVWMVIKVLGSRDGVEGDFGIACFELEMWGSLILTRFILNFFNLSKHNLSCLFLWLVFFNFDEDVMHIFRIVIFWLFAVMNSLIFDSFCFFLFWEYINIYDKKLYWNVHLKYLYAYFYDTFNNLGM